MQKLVQLLEDRENLDRLLDRIEERAEERRADDMKERMLRD